MTASPSQGEIGTERMCQLAGISRSGYSRHWPLSAPRQEETGLRDAIQRLAVKHRHYGYRRIGALLWREGWQTNHKRVLRLMREDNPPFCPNHDELAAQLAPYGQNIDPRRSSPLMVMKYQNRRDRVLVQLPSSSIAIGELSRFAGAWR